MPRLAIVACLVLSAAVPSHAQTGSAPDFATALAELGAAMPDPDDAALARQITTCLRPLFPEQPDHADVTLGIEIGEDGRPGDPFLLVPPAEEATLAHLRQLFRAELAVYDCAPLSLPGGLERPRILRLRVTDTGLAPVTAAEAAPAIATAPQAGEDALGLDRAARREIQIRLRLAGHDPQGADGIFGERTRRAIADWQTAVDLRPTGFLNAEQRERLTAATEESYAAFIASRPAQPQRSRRFFTGRDGCLRYANGQIVPNRSLACDLRGLAQSL